MVINGQRRVSRCILEWPALLYGCGISRAVGARFVGGMLVYLLT